MTPILVTGGAGFIGSHACKELATAGYQPVVLDNLSTGWADAVRWGPLEHVDVRNAEAVANLLRAHQIKTVMHFAASAYVGESVAEPGKYYSNNVGGIISILDACNMAGVEEFIFSSSCATYGLGDGVPIDERTPQAPINPYGHTKLMCEQMLRDTSAATGLKFAILRYFNAAGCDPDGELAERHDPETHLIPLALLAATGRHPRLSVFGTDYDTRDGTCVRDYIHVSDLARGHVLAVQALRSGMPSVTANLGRGDGHSVLEILTAIQNVTGLSVPHTLAGRRAGDPAVLVADVTRARELLGFSAALSDIDTIIRHAAPTFGIGVQHANCA